MINKKLKSINIRRILDLAIDDEQIINEQKSFTCVDILRPLRAETSESRITEALRILVEEGIFRDKRTFTGRPPRYLRCKDRKLKEDKQTNRNNYYQIVQNLSALEKIFYIYLDEGSEKFLSSLYINNIIKNLGFATVYDKIKPYLERSNFRKIATISLLAQSATMDEYKDKYRFFDEYFAIYDEKGESEQFKSYKSSKQNENLASLVFDRPYYYTMENELKKIEDNIGCSIKPIRSNRIKMLAEFDPLYAVPFCRDTIHKDIRDLFNNLYEKKLVTHSLVQFMEYDSYLSPFTSYPIYTPSALLFYRPFHRLFEDVYLLNKSDLSKMILRAYTIYVNFGEILFEYFRNNFRNCSDIDQYIRQFIFQWNVTHANLDSIFYYLSDVYREKIGSGKYHVGISGAEIQAIDLENNEQIPDHFEIISDDGLEYTTEEENRPPIIDNIFAGLDTDTLDPYENLISCYWFEEFDDCPTSIQIGEIQLDLSLRLDYGIGENIRK